MHPRGELKRSQRDYKSLTLLREPRFETIFVHLRRYSTPLLFLTLFWCASEASRLFGPFTFQIGAWGTRFTRCRHRRWNVSLSLRVRVCPGIHTQELGEVQPLSATVGDVEARRPLLITCKTHPCSSDAESHIFML